MIRKKENKTKNERVGTKQRGKREREKIVDSREFEDVIRENIIENKKVGSIQRKTEEEKERKQLSRVN